MRPHRTALIRVLLCLGLLSQAIFSPAHADPIIAGHRASDDFGLVPDSMIAVVQDSLRIFYGHTSHGSQVVTGLDMLAAENALYERPTFYEYYGDLGHYGDLSWVAPTRSFLDAHPDYNVVMWSWCGGVSDNSEEGIDAYLAAMCDLEADYPGVQFVYMTGHLDGTGPSGNLYLRNNQIRAFCSGNGKVLFDFADIESWDPDGNEYPWESDACGWCSDWCAVHECPSCPDCAHSHCFNCYRKGMAWWWMAARMLGWDETVGAPGAGDAPVPSAALLRPNRPNPFNPLTEIAFILPAAGPARVTVHDVAGRALATLIDEERNAGEHHVTWDGRDASGAAAPSGVYFVQLRFGAEIVTRKIALVR